MRGIQAVIERANAQEELATSWELTGRNKKMNNSYDHKTIFRQRETTNLILWTLQLSVFLIVGNLWVQPVINRLNYGINSQQRILQDPCQLSLPVSRRFLP